MVRLIFLLLTFAALLFADDRIPNIDFTCDTCSRRYLDSLNVYDRPVIRVNQIGFRPSDNHKFAFVAEPTAMTFKVVDASSGTSAWEGNLTPLGTWTKPGIWVNGAFSSIHTVYEFGDTTSSGTENLYSADFSGLSREKRRFVCQSIIDFLSHTKCKIEKRLRASNTPVKRKEARKCTGFFQILQF